MNIGMLWFDNDPKKSLQQKIDGAVQYYEKKYGRKPNLVFVHPTMMLTPSQLGETQIVVTDLEKTDPSKPFNELTYTGITVRSNRSVLPNHLWVGVEGDEAKERYVIQKEQKGD